MCSGYIAWTVILYCGMGVCHFVMEMGPAGVFADSRQFLYFCSFLTCWMVRTLLRTREVMLSNWLGKTGDAIEVDGLRGEGEVLGGEGEEEEWA